MAQSGWPIDADKMDLVMEHLRPARFDRFAGSHHFHADPETATAVAEAVLEFIQTPRDLLMSGK
jgi:hypothetical protein